jgi:hypothetical protein
MKFLCSKTVRHHFWPGLIPPLWTGGSHLLWAVPFTKPPPLILACDAAPKLFSWAKPAHFDFSSCNFTLEGHILSTVGDAVIRLWFFNPLLLPFLFSCQGNNSKLLSRSHLGPRSKSTFKISTMTSGTMKYFFNKKIGKFWGIFLPSVKFNLFCYFLGKS